VLELKGYERFVESQDEFLRKSIVQKPNAPVGLLLLNPLTHKVDPDSNQLAAYLSVVTEMGMPPAADMKRLQRTLECRATIQ